VAKELMYLIVDDEYGTEADGGKETDEADGG